MFLDRTKKRIEERHGRGGGGDIKKEKFLGVAGGCGAAVDKANYRIYSVRPR